MRFTIDSLTAGEIYEIRIIAVNAAGESSPSNSVQVIAAAVPDQPLPVSKIYGDREQITFGWQAPDDGGLPIIAYQIMWDGIQTDEF
jgi:hypothetical protein